MSMDLVNGLWMVLAAVVQSSNISSIHKHKTVKGFNPWSLALFTCFGVWNIFYFFNLGQLWSTLGSFLIVLINFIWLLMVIFYKFRIEG